MKDLLSILMLTLLGSMCVFAAPVEQYTEKDPKSVLSSWLSKLQPIHTKSKHSTHSTSHGPHKVSIRTHEADEQDVKTKTETRIITEDCSATDDMVRTTIVEMVPSTRVLEYTPSYRTTKTIIQTVLYDVTKTASSSRSRKPTKHTLTETVSSPSSTVTTKSSKKHTKSSKTHTKHHSSKTTESAPPSSSASSSLSSKSVVVVTTSEVVEVVTVGYTEVTSTMTLTDGDSRLSSMTQTSSTGSSSAAGSLNWPPYLTDLSKFSDPPFPTWPADAVVEDVKGIATSNMSPSSTSLRTIHQNATSQTPSLVDIISHHTTTAAVLPTAETQAANDIVENLSARDDDDDPDHDYKKYRKPDKAMSKRMSRWSKHHSKLMRKQSSYSSEAWFKSYTKSIKSANKASRKKHHHDDDDEDDQVASAGLPAREVSMAAPAITYVEVTVTTTVLPTQNETYSISIRTVHASKTASVMDSVSTSKASKKHSKTHSRSHSKSHSKASSKTSSKAHKSSSRTSSKTASPTASEMDIDGMATSTYPWPTFTKTCEGVMCLWTSEGPAPSKTTLEAEDATMSSTVSEQYPAEERKHCMNDKCYSWRHSKNVVSTIKSWTPRPSSISTGTQDAFSTYSRIIGDPPKSTVVGDNGM